MNNGKVYQLNSGDSLMVNNVTVNADETEHLSEGVVLLKAGFFTIINFDFGLKVMWDGGQYHILSKELVVVFVCALW